jgi:hypothetical protein
VGGWLVGNCDIKANSVQFQVKLPTGIELGKNNILYDNKEFFKRFSNYHLLIDVIKRDFSITF